MFYDFSEEALPKIQYVLRLTRHKVIGGWYVRVIFTEMGSGAGARNESALFVADAEHVWQIDNLFWEMIDKEPGGGIYRSPIFGGWLVLSTARGEGKNEDGVKHKARIGSLVYIPDAVHEWKCTI